MSQCSNEYLIKAFTDVCNCFYLSVNAVIPNLQWQWRIQDFPLWGPPTRWGGANLRRIHFSVKMYVKMKEMDPVGGCAPVAPRGSANEWNNKLSRIELPDQSI